jgi:hypothetical protein
LDSFSKILEVFITTNMCLYVGFYNWIFNHNGHLTNLVIVKTNWSF